MSHNIVGGVLTQRAYLILRGLKTLSLRVERHNSNAQRLAEWLEAHLKIAKVHYPGLKSHQDHEVAKKYMTGFGGVVSFEVDGFVANRQVYRRMQVAVHRAVFGCVKSLIEQPTVVSTGIKDLKKERRLVLKTISFDLMVSKITQISKDFKQALDKPEESNKHKQYLGTRGTTITTTSKQEKE